MPLRFTEKSLKEDLVERLGNIISHLSNGYKNLPTLRDEIFRKWNFLQNLEYCSVIYWISPLKQIKKKCYYWREFRKKSDPDLSKQIVYRNFEIAFLCFEFGTNLLNIFECGTHRIEPISLIIGTVWPKSRNIVWDMIMSVTEFSIENYILEPDRSG